jgi:hypothetical protein
MTPDIADIIGMARKAGFMPAHDNRVERFAALVAAAEREACAKVCENMNSILSPEIAAAIRSRSAK